MMKVEKGTPEANKIEPKLDLIQIMGWPSRPVNVTINEKELDYTFVESTKRLTLHCDVDMNANATIVFKL